jgi:hypothetical protein
MEVWARVGVEDVGEDVRLEMEALRSVGLGFVRGAGERKR